MSDVTTDAEKTASIPSSSSDTAFQFHDGDSPIVTPGASESEQIRELAQHFGVDHRKLMWKIDIRLVPMLCILYLWAFLDRVNISNATLYNLKEDLNLTEGDRYNTVLTVFFVPYILFEVPSNMLMKKLRPHLWLSFCMFMFGFVSIMQGLTQNYAGIIVTRLFLGLCEAGMFPGCFYLLAMWYVRSEAQKRYSFFFSSTTLAGAFGGLLATAIGLMDGMHGYSGWRWIFIIEGIATCAIAFCLYFLIVDFPEEAKFLATNEREFIKAKLALDVGQSQHVRKATLRDVGNVFKDYKVILVGFMYFGLIVPSYGYAYFAPTIIKAFNYGSTVQTQLHSVPPWVVACGASMISATLSDYFRHRYLFTVVLTSIAIVGFGMLLGIHDNKKAEYAALFLCAMGCYSAMPIVVCWTTTNFAGHLRRGVGSGFQIGFGNIGGIIATFAFLSVDAPYYTKGYAISLAFAGLSIISCTLYEIAIMWENRRRQRGIGLEKWEKMSEDDRVFAGDLSPEFRYCY
ncbi:major facilitator superfamily domain-containing protein [Lipomyces oligophaga]|uniref:major facilitator superfamily domain-containing protein n=1 Tax=Lipomyces oligophaga TaxID=45792 RepID=UPI0034CD5792